jgi:hypothetical protein
LTASTWTSDPGASIGRLRCHPIRSSSPVSCQIEVQATHVVCSCLFFSTERYYVFFCPVRIVEPELLSSMNTELGLPGWTIHLWKKLLWPVSCKFFFLLWAVSCEKVENCLTEMVVSCEKNWCLLGNIYNTLELCYSNRL